LVVATAVVNVANAVYHRLMSRQLGVAYADLGALVAVSSVLSNVTLGLQTWLVKAFAHDAELRGPGAVGARLRGLAGPGLLALGGTFAVLLALSEPLALYLKLPSAGLAMLVAGVFCSGVLLLALRAAMQGLHRFGWLGGSLIAEGLGKVGAAWAWGNSAATALLAIMAGQGGGMLLAGAGLLGLGSAPRSKAKPAAEWRAALHEASADTLVLTLFALMAFLDVMVMKHHHPDERAALYNRAALVGKAFLYLASAFTLVILPATARAMAAKEDPRPLLRRFLLAALGLDLLGLAGLWALTPLCLWLLVGPGYESLAPLTRWFGLAVIPLALLQLVLTYLLAVRQRGLVAAMGVLVLAYWGLLELNWDSELRVVASLGLSATLGLVYFLPVALRHGSSRRT
jgi:O-antigen/teichoic acid export membrane protein